MEVIAKAGFASLQIGVVFIGEGHLGSILHLLLVLLKQCLVDGGSWGSKGGCGNEFLFRIVSRVIFIGRGSVDLPNLGYRRAFAPTTRMASRSCSWIWRRYRSIEGSSFGGK